MQLLVHLLIFAFCPCPLLLVCPFCCAWCFGQPCIDTFVELPQSWTLTDLRRSFAPILREERSFKKNCKYKYDWYLDKYNYRFGQIQSAIWTNTFWLLTDLRRGEGLLQFWAKKGVWTSNGTLGTKANKLYWAALHPDCIVKDDLILLRNMIFWRRLLLFRKAIFWNTILVI